MSMNVTEQPNAVSKPSLTDSLPPREGTTARAIEKQTSRVPSDTFLWAAAGAVGAALLLRVGRQKNASLFLGQWVSPLLLLGVYNKVVKLGGSDRYSG